MNDAIGQLIKLEPVRVRAVVGAIIGLLLAFGIDVDGGGIMALVDAALPLLGSLLVFISARGAVTPNAKVVVSTDDVERLGADL